MENRFHVYKSSAGSGKTFTLVKEFLKLCFREESNYFSSILAITFTNKATQELKSRLLESLKELAFPERERGAMSKVLSTELEMEEEEIEQKAAAILSAILHNYGDFSISTIDRFSHRLIRTFAKDLKLPMNFQLEIDANRILEESIAALIESVGRDPKLTEFLIAFVLFRVEEESTWRLEDDLKKFSYNLIQDKNSPFLDALKQSNEKDFEALKQELNAFLKKTEQKIEGIKTEGEALLKDNGLEVEVFYYGKGGIGNYFNKIGLNKAESFLIGANMQKAIDQDKWYSGKATEVEISSIEGIKPRFMELVEEVQAFVEGELARYYAYSAIRNNIYSLSLIKEIDKRIEQYKKDERVLPLSDFNKKIATVVLKESIPFIYLRMGERYKHLMIDEFQDTSVLQFMNLLPLMENALSEGKMNMIVGDAKQAIYRFRGGELRQLAEMPNFLSKQFKENDWVKMRMQTLKQQYLEMELMTNYRSAEAVVNFNNHFFSFLSNYDLLEKEARTIFSGYSQDIKESAIDKGMVEVAFLESTSTEDHLEYTLAAIHEALADNYSPKDIAVLCKRNDNAAAVANHLKENNIAVVSSEALLIKNIPQVKFLINMAIWLGNDADVKAKKDIIAFLELENRLDTEVDSYFEKYIKKEEDLRGLFHQLGIVIDAEEVRLKPLHLLFESLIRLFQLDEKFDIYIQSFQEEVLTFSQNNGNNLNDFIAWWEEYQDKLALDIPQGTDAVEVLTIHKSKGLDYPVVIIPFLKKNARPPKGDLWVPKLSEIKANVPYFLVQLNKNLEHSVYKEHYLEEVQQSQIDILNVLYVAFTRAADRMYLCSDPAPKNASIADASLLDAFVRFQNKEVIETNGIEKYRWGSKGGKEIDKEEVIKEAEAFEIIYHSSSWDEKLEISKDAQNNWQMEGEESSQRYYGNLLHDLLAEIHCKSDSIEIEIEAVLNKRLFDGEIDEKEMELLKQELTTIVRHPEISPLFDKAVKSKREAALITEEGKVLRPDLVVFFDEKWVVVDYKTGEKNESHQAQLLGYMQALSKMTSQPIEGVILYTNTLELVKVA